MVRVARFARGFAMFIDSSKNRRWKRSLLPGALVAGLIMPSWGCGEPVEPPRPTPMVSLDVSVQFPAPPVALTSLVAVLTPTSGPTTTITLSVVGSTGARIWSGTGQVSSGAYAVVLEGLNGGTVIYRGTGFITVGDQGGTFRFFMVCVNTACRPSTGGIVTMIAILPDYEVEDNSTVATSNVLGVNGDLPLQGAAGNGVIGPHDGDEDVFSLTFTDPLPGDTIVVIVYAQQAGSSLDAVADLLDATGNVLLTVDDLLGLDPLIVFTTTTSSSTYHLRIRSIGGTTGEYTAGVFLCYAGNRCADLIPAGG